LTERSAISVISSSQLTGVFTWDSSPFSSKKEMNSRRSLNFILGIFGNRFSCNQQVCRYSLRGLLNRAIVTVVRTRVQQRSLRPGSRRAERKLKRVVSEVKRKGRHLYRPLLEQAIGLLVLCARVPVLAETVAAINWAIPPRTEGYHSIRATLGAGYRVHFAGTITPASPFLIAP